MRDAIGQHVLIVGASGRAAAWSALRAGLVPSVIDLFADGDMHGRCLAHRIEPDDYPHDLAEMMDELPPGPVIYTGALENHPNVLKALANKRRLWGNSPAVVQGIRRPEEVARLLEQQGLPCPRLTDAPPTDGRRWLNKPRASAGGKNIRFWNGETPGSSRYLQEWIDGLPCAAIFLGKPDRADLLGVTKQLVGIPWLHARPFQYCGSVGPLPLPAQANLTLNQIGQALVQAFGLRGLFGVDFVVRDDTPWPVEINPRYTASVEIVERATGVCTLGLHGRVFEPTLPVPSSFVCRGEFHGKAILFARQALTFPDDGPWRSALAGNWDLEQGEDFADLPWPGARIDAGQPILTLFARADSMSGCENLLQDIARDLDRRLFQ